MSQLREKQKKTKDNSFVWTDDEVLLLLKVTLDYKTAKTMENIDWESCQTKYSDILDLCLVALNTQRFCSPPFWKISRGKRLVLILWRQRIQKYTDTSVHTYPDTQRIQKFPLWRAYTEISGYTERIRRTRVDARCIRIKKFADTKISGYVWTGPQSPYLARENNFYDVICSVSLRVK